MSERRQGTRKEAGPPVPHAPPHVQDERHRDWVRIGYVESVDLPDWGVEGLRAKIDTGARSSALHVDDIEPLAGGRVRFAVVLNRKTGTSVRVETAVARVARVRSSSGVQEERYFVVTTMRLGDVVKAFEVSLTSRDSMQFRMLLGRTALSHDFLIDAGRRYLTGKRPIRRIRKATKKRRKEKGAPR